MNKNKPTVDPLKSCTLVIPRRLALKTSFINIRLNSSRTEVTDCYDYLGWLIDSNLFFNGHKSMIIFKLSEVVKIMNALKKIKIPGIL